MLPRAGQKAEFRILGTAKTWTFVGVIVQENDATLVIRRDSDGVTYTIPRHAVREVRALPTAEPNPAPTGPPSPIGPLLTKIESQTSQIVAYDDSRVGEGIADLVRGAAILLEELQEIVTSARHARSIAALLEMIDSSLATLLATNPSDAKAAHERYEASRKRCKRALDLTRSDGKLSHIQRDLFRAVSRIESDHWSAICKRYEAHPRLVVGSRMSLNLSQSGEFLLPLRVALDNSEVAAKGIRLVLDQHRGVELVGNSPMIEELQPGNSVAIQARLMDRRRQGARDDIRVVAHLEYLGLNDELLRSTQHKISVRLRRPVAFQPIENPFREFASGIPVDDPEMFFGRRTLIEDILSQLAHRPTGRCFGLYGQKRTGKSSVIEQVRVRLEQAGALVAVVSMGTVDRSAITATFVSEALDQLRVQVASRLDSKTFANLLTRWPDQRAIVSQPLASFRRACAAARALIKAEDANEQRIVIIVDEFTYLYELLRRDHVATADQDQLRDFMRQWKSLLESKTFSALVVGQDTMPYFLQAFPNEFSVMHTERLGYLTSDETESLADKPIRRSDGSSRFAGFGLVSIYSYTAGHPYFTQIVCDRIVTMANERKRTEITEFEVETAIDTLLEGTSEIGFHRFDCLLSADNTGVIVSETALAELEEQKSDNVALTIAHRLARLAGPQNKSVDVDALDLTRTEQRVLRDLILREVVTEREGRVNIKVLLFAEYLRRMSS